MAKYKRYNTGKYYELVQWLEKSDLDTEMPADLKEYNAVIDIAHDVYKVFGNRAKGMNYMCKLLHLKFPDIPKNQLQNYIYEAINLYYAETLENKEVYRNIKLQDLDKLLALAYEDNDFELCRRIIRDQAELKGLYNPDENSIPEDFFRPQVVVYSINPEDVGRKPIDKKELWNQIKQFKLSKPEQKILADEIGYQELSSETD